MFFIVFFCGGVGADGFAGLAEPVFAVAGRALPVALCRSRFAGTAPTPVWCLFLFFSK
ncbi:MAG: hypothetical protein LBM59_03445 [Ruminococcus sp.]|jgi:hypothetical protein|nr:hypothetical protein [Ruminococcus sp.]